MTLRLLVIGAPEGSHEALLAWVSALPPELALPIVVVGQGQVGGALLAPTLQARGALPVCELEDKASLVAGTVHVAPAGYHLLMEDGGSVALSTEAPLWGARPAIDPLFESAADAYGPGTMAILIEATGPDGVHGLTRIAERGGVALASPLVADVVAVLPRTTGEAA